MTDEADHGTPPDPQWSEPVSRAELARWPTPPLRAVVEERGMSHALLAEQLGISFSTMRRLVAGGDRLTTDQAERICAVIGVVPSAVWANWVELLGLRVWEPTPWATRAACKGHDEHFFPPVGERPENAEAREHFAIVEYCARCPVAVECRDYARRNREYGIWGGETELDRAEAGFAPALPMGRVARAAQLHRLEHL